VLRALATVVDQTGLEVRNVSCRVCGQPPGYAFAVAPYTPWNAIETARVAEGLDIALGVQSAGYRAARAQGRLAPTRLRLLDAAAFDREWHARVAAGTRPAQVKDKLFRPNPADWDRLVTPPEGP
jgi:hypothetical protein